MAESIIIPWTHDYHDYLRDESRCSGEAEWIAFPTSEVEVIEVVRECRRRHSAITAQGARTGITAGATPCGGLVLSLSRMNATGEIRQDGQTGDHFLTVQPGALLADVQKAAAQQGLFFPPDPTETSASIGGMVANNASGAVSFFYGPTRNWVKSLGVILSDGSVVRLGRGANAAQGRRFELTTEEGRLIQGALPSYAQPDVKSAAGYYVADDMDLLDLFIGMEGTLGVITEIELKLIPKPQALAGLSVFLPSEEAALTFARVMRGENVEGFAPISIRPAAIEFFNHDSLDLLRRMKSDYEAFAAIPALKPDFHTAVYIEFHADSEDIIEDSIMQTMDVMAGLDASDEDAWCATTDRELEPIRAFRHAIPEAVNLLIDERKRSFLEITKLSTDMSAPDPELRAVMAMYNSGLKENGLESVIFGHIGDNHVHVNILPNSAEDYEKGKSLYLSWARQVVEMGGSVSAEHGIGKLKVPFLELMYGPEGVQEMLELKRLFDPELILNPGNLFGHHVGAL